MNYIELIYTKLKILRQHLLKIIFRNTTFKFIFQLRQWFEYTTLTFLYIEILHYTTSLINESHVYEKKFKHYNEKKNKQQNYPGPFV